jgi:hypothetical protein
MPCRYFAEASSINFRRSARYGIQTLGALVQFGLQKFGLAKFAIFNSRA